MWAEVQLSCLRACRAACMVGPPGYESRPWGTCLSSSWDGNGELLCLIMKSHVQYITIPPQIKEEEK
jgi:hypothetical protein